MDDPPKWLRWVPLFAILVTVLSFMFALFVLYPWHPEFFKQLRKI